MRRQGPSGMQRGCRKARRCSQGWAAFRASRENSRQAPTPPNAARLARSFSSSPCDTRWPTGSVTANSSFSRLNSRCQPVQVSLTLASASGEKANSREEEVEVEVKCAGKRERERSPSRRRRPIDDRRSSSSFSSRAEAALPPRGTLFVSLFPPEERNRSRLSHRRVSKRSKRKLPRLRQSNLQAPFFSISLPWRRPPPSPPFWGAPGTCRRSSS